jgi:hypothetical protein
MFLHSTYKTPANFNDRRTPWTRVQAAGLAFGRGAPLIAPSSACVTQLVAQSLM